MTDLANFDSSGIYAAKDLVEAHLMMLEPQRQRVTSNDIGGRVKVVRTNDNSPPKYDFSSVFDPGGLWKTAQDGATLFLGFPVTKLVRYSIYTIGFILCWFLIRLFWGISRRVYKTKRRTGCNMIIILALCNFTYKLFNCLINPAAQRRYRMRCPQCRTEHVLIEIPDDLFGEDNLQHQDTEA